MAATRIIQFLSILLLCTQSCSFEESSEIVQLESADLTLLKNFNIQLKGEPKYQFYEKYGFTDVEEHLIIVLEKPDDFRLQNELPIDSTSLKSLNKIQTEKFTGSFWEKLDNEREFLSDIRLEAKEYFPKKFELHFSKGSYQIKKEDRVEMVVILDNNNNLVFIEVKREL